MVPGPGGAGGASERGSIGSHIPEHELSAALIDAAYDGQASAAERFVLLKADVNCVDAEGYTPLMIAASLGQSTCIEAILQVCCVAAHDVWRRVCFPGFESVSSVSIA